MEIFEFLFHRSIFYKKNGKKKEQNKKSRNDFNKILVYLKKIISCSS